VNLITDEFELRPFEKVALPQSDKGKRIKQRDYLPHGKLPVVDQGQSDIGGYTDDESMCFSGSLPVVIFGDHTRAVKLVNHPFVVGADGIKIFSPAVDVLPKYLYYWMKSAPIENRGYGRHYQYLRKLNVPVPSMAKQQAIVDEIETQFSRLDEAVANLQRVKANLKRYKASVLKAAVEGHLVEIEANIAQREGHSYETGQQLLQSTLEARKEQWVGRGKYKTPEAPQVSDTPLPEGWAWATLEQLHLQIADVDHKMPKAQDSGIPYISTKDFFGDEDIDFSKAKLISAEDYEALCRKVKPERGDLLLSRYGTVGEVREVSVDDPFQASYSVAILKPVRGFVPIRFLIAALRSDVVQRQIKRDVRATAQPDLGLAHIRQFVVPVPPMAEQLRILEELDRQLSILRGIEAEVENNLIRAQTLRQSTLSEAFLTNQLQGTVT
jgi:type I restriction enzyme S subunit